jgi:outer membrane lipoprotein SlyB
MIMVEKIKSTVTAAPMGAAAGAIVGYFVAKKLGYDKTISVIGFTMVGLIVGSAIGQKIKM